MRYAVNGDGDASVRSLQHEMLSACVSATKSIRECCLADVLVTDEMTFHCEDC